MKKILYILSILIFTAGACYADAVKARLPAPEFLPNTAPEMNDPGFWIAYHPFPDKVIMTPSEITAFNKKTETELGLIKDVSLIGPVSRSGEIASRIEGDIKDLRDKALYNMNAELVGDDFYKRLEGRLGLAPSDKDIDVRYGFTCRRADQRTIPSGAVLTEEPGYREFDMVQNSSLDIGTPLAIRHETKDGRWLYVDAPTSWGWIKKEDVVFCTIDELKSLLNRGTFVVVTSPKAGIFRDLGRRDLLEYAHMGVRFPLVEDTEILVKVLIPGTDDKGKFSVREVYMNKGDVHVGYLTYTPRVMIEEAFRFLGTPYGWGGVPGESDCSGFIQSIFATVGIILPRNAYEEKSVGRALDGFEEEGNAREKADILMRDAAGGITTAWVKGHIMLYIGSYKNRPYVIHATYGYREMTAMGLVARVINKVVVSDLSLGEGSPRGSLASRLLSVRIIDNGKIKNVRR